MLESVLLSFLVLDVGLLFALVEKMVKTAPREYETNDGSHPIGDDWEYKIVQVRGGAFRSLRALQYVCQQEAKFGWTLFEKIDDSRLRLKRLVSARSKDALLKQNPYRTDYGVSGDFMTFLSIVATLMLLAIPAYFGFAFMKSIFQDLDVNTPRQIQKRK